jgi:hypothetical protein
VSAYEGNDDEPTPEPLSVRDYLVPAICVLAAVVTLTALISLLLNAAWTLSK